MNDHKPLPNQKYNWCSHAIIALLWGVATVGAQSTSTEPIFLHGPKEETKLILLICGWGSAIAINAKANAIFHTRYSEQTSRASMMGGCVIGSLFLSSLMMKEESLLENGNRIIKALQQASLDHDPALAVIALPSSALQDKQIALAIQQYQEATALQPVLALPENYQYFLHTCIQGLSKRLYGRKLTYLFLAGYTFAHAISSLLFALSGKSITGA